MAITAIVLYDLKSEQAGNFSVVKGSSSASVREYITSKIGDDYDKVITEKERYQYIINNEKLKLIPLCRQKFY